MRVAVMYFMGACGLTALWLAGYWMGKESMFRSVLKYFAIYHAGNPHEGQGLVRFLEKQ